MKEGAMTQWKVGCGESASVVEVTAIMCYNVNLPICSSSRVSYRYHLAHCTYNHELEQKQTLYISQPESHQVCTCVKPCVEGSSC